MLLFAPLTTIYLSVALLYNVGMFVYNVHVWLDAGSFITRLRCTKKQTGIVSRMQEVESSLAELRSQIVLR
jgi:hypothetical protein